MVGEADAVLAPSGGRRFGISDGMILLVGVAFALSTSTHLMVLLADTFGRLCRVISAHAGDLPTRPSTFWGVIRDPLRNVVGYGFQVGIAVMICLTPAWIVVRLRRPRASWRDLLRQPGTVAAMAMIVGFFWGTGTLIILLPDHFDSMAAMPSAIGGAVALAWAVLALSRRWQAEPGWIDRIGCLLGCLAVGLAALCPLISRI